MTLISTFDVHEDESVRGYYRRLAADNSLRSWRELAGMANVPRTPAALLVCPEHVASELGLDPTWAERAAQREQLARTWRGLRRTMSDAVCPACLDEHPHLRVSWEHGFSTACPTHRTRLVDRCPDCGELLSPNRACIALCTCGNDLRAIAAPASTPAQHWLSTLIASSGKSAGGVEPTLDRLDVNVLCEFVRDVCRGMDPAAPPARKGATSVATVQEAMEFLAPLEQLLEHWPSGFKAHVSARIRAGAKDARTLNTLLGGWYARLKKACNDTPLQPFLEAVLEVAAKEFDGVLSLDAAAHVAKEFTQSVLVKDAARTLGVTFGLLHSNVKSGECAATTHRLGTRSLVYHVPVSEVERIARLRQDWISEEDACALAKVSPAVMHLMMEASVVESDTQWRKDLLKGGAVRKASLEALCSSLCRTQGRQRFELVGDCVLWSELTSRRMGDRRAIQAVMQAASSGELRPAFRGRHLGETSFFKSDVAKYFGTPVLETGMSVQQLSQTTGWKWESIGNWIDIGLLKAERVTLRGQPCRVVTPEHLLSFRLTYLPLADLAKTMGTRPSYLAEQLTGIEIVGAKLLPNGGRRGGLVRVADLGRLALEASKSSSSPQRHLTA